MALFELRTYQVSVGKMKDVVEAYTKKGWPALQKSGLDKKLVGYFISDTGGLHQVIHLWRFEDHNDRRSHWDNLFADSSSYKKTSISNPVFLISDFFFFDFQIIL